MVLGASFDTVEENRAFAERQQLPFALLSDVERTVGAAYEVLRPAGDRLAAFPERFSYLIDPTGVIRRSYSVADVADHAEVVLADLRRFQAERP